MNSKNSNRKLVLRFLFSLWFMIVAGAKGNYPSARGGGVVVLVDYD